MNEIIDANEHFNIKCNFNLSDLKSNEKWSVLLKEKF